MKARYLAVIFLVLVMLSVSLAHAQPPPSGSVSSAGSSLLTGLTSGNSSIYAGFFAIVMFVIFAIALDRTQLSSGRIAISFIFALITFFVLYTDNALLHFFLNTFIVLAFIALILGMLALVKSPRSIRLIGVVIALFLVIILFENDSGLTNFASSTLHFPILTVLPYVFGMVAVAVFIILLLRVIKTHSNIVLRAVLLFIILLLIALLIPGFAGFLFNPITFVSLIAIMILAIFFIKRTGRVGPKLSKRDKLDIKQQNLQTKVLGKINKRKQKNQKILDKYQALSKKQGLSPKEQAKLGKFKEKLTKSAWENVSNRVDLTKNQYSSSQLSNNPALQSLTQTGFLAKRKALKELKQKSVERASNTKSNISGELSQLASAVNAGQYGSKVSEKAARKIYDQRITKELRTKDVSNLLHEKENIMDPNLNLSKSTRKKLIKRIDRSLGKLTKNKFIPKSADQMTQKSLAKEQKQQARQEALEDNRLANAQLEAARRNAAAEQQKKAEQERLQEQAKLAEAARQEALRKQEEELKKRAESTSNAAVGQTSALDRRIKTPLWFTPKSPVDEKGKLDVQVQNELEVHGLTHRREDLVNLINSGKLSGRDLKNAKNELDRIDYRLKKYGREIHR